MVSSRDSVIDELNDRVAVFEEDKVVLKAALRQLQKEMKDEGPKTQKLVLDLDTARDGMCVFLWIFHVIFLIFLQYIYIYVCIPFF